ncbi:DUF397 domain-containing protein [Streptomyces griseosporeus]|uniref:DUF397 domain-containing protein n=1 Tax=Streptomyces griseosporeus TaxID=1910 RepID=UPI0037AEFFCA
MSADLQWFKSSYSGDQGKCLRNSAAMTDSVNAALEGAIKRRKRASFLGWLAEGGLPDLTGPIERPADTRK